MSGGSLGAVEEILQAHVGVQVSSPDFDLIESGTIDSLAVVELVFQLEQRFAIRIDLEQLDLDDLRSAQRIAQFVDARRDRAPSGQSR